MYKILSKTDVTTRYQRNMLLTDWSTTDRVLIAWPELNGHDNLTLFFNNIVEFLHDIPLLILVKRNSQIDLLKINPYINQHSNLHFLPCEELNSISIGKDFPVLVRNLEGNFTSYKNQQLPEDRKKIKLFNRLLGSLGSNYPQSDFPLELNFDPGYLVHNGNGFGIISNRLISVNENLSIETINNILFETFGLVTILYIPLSKEMNLGYINTMVRFVDENNLLIVDYNQNIYKEEHKFFAKLANQILTFIKTNHLDIFLTRIQNYVYLDKDNKRETASYLEFLRVNDTVFLPQYGTPYHDEVAFDTLMSFKAVIPALEVRPLGIQGWSDLALENIRFSQLFWLNFQTSNNDTNSYHEKTGVNPDTQLINYFLKNNLDFTLPQHIYFLIEDTIQRFWEKDEKTMDTTQFFKELENVFRINKINIRRKSFTKITDVITLALQKYRFMS